MNKNTCTGEQMEHIHKGLDRAIYILEKDITECETRIANNKKKLEALLKLKAIPGVKELIDIASV